MKSSVFFLLTVLAKSALAQSSSHPPLHEIPAPANRPLPAENVLFVDNGSGNDANTGSTTQPWKTISHALAQLKAGDTLAIREGIYFENLYCAVAGTSDQPITIRACPGEQVIIDGGMREFQDDPASCWEPLDNGEYRSAKVYRNIRDVLVSPERIIAA